MTRGVWANRMKEHHNIYRIDIEATPAYPNRHPTHGWQVRIRRQGKQHTKFFSDVRYGGKKKALKEALTYRDDLIEELPEPDDPVAQSARVRSKTGVVGLNFSMKDDGSGKQKPYIQLSWLMPDGARKSASYSVDKWGLRRALWNACTRLHREKPGVEQEPAEMYATAYAAITKKLTKKQRERMETADQRAEASGAEMPPPDAQAAAEEAATKRRRRAKK